jgi:hypothetical protein
MKQIIPLAEGWQVAGLSSSGRLDADTAARLSQGEDGTVEEWLSAQMPAQVHDVLVAHGRLEDPWKPGAGEQAAWVDKQDWVYRREFARPAAEGRVMLRCLGLDTVVDVYLNGEHIAFSDDMFVPLRVDVTDVLGECNVLLLHFRAPLAYVETLKMDPAWEGKVTPTRLLRKTGDDFGTFSGGCKDYSPIGVYDEVRLEVIDRGEIDELAVHYRLSDGLDFAWLTLAAGGSGAAPGASLHVAVTDEDGQAVCAGSADVSTEVDGRWVAEVRLEVDRPRLWWPRNLGDQPLYTVTTELRIDGEAVDRRSRRIGLRKLTWDEPFRFRVNDRPLTVWGANLNQADGVTHVADAGRIDRILERVVNADFNALRLWGPGQPYPPRVLDECSRRGILVFFEFAHTGGCWPDSPEFRRKCVREAEHWVGEYRHHPCILLWCGNNESHMYAPRDKKGRYLGQDLFETDYRRVCERMDPGRFYHPSSPAGGAYANDPRAGDSHSYNHLWFVTGEHFPVQFSENTRSAPPLVKSLRRFIDPDRFWPGDFTGMVTGPDDLPLPASWMELTWNPAFMLGRFGEVGRFYDTNTTPEGLVYRFGQAQGEYIRRNVERYRRGKPLTDPDGPRRTSGHFWWKLNSTWPMVYSELIDYLLEPNMGYYAMKRAYAPLLLSFEITDRVHLWVVNDTGIDVEGQLLVRRYDADGARILDEFSRAVGVRAGESHLAMTLEELGMFWRGDRLHAELRDPTGRTLAQTIDCTGMERHLRIPRAEISLAPAPDGVVVSCDVFARCVELAGDADGEQFGWLFEDNHFDLLPDKPRRIGILGDHDAGTITAGSFWSDHRASIDWSRA